MNFKVFLFLLFALFAFTFADTTKEETTQDQHTYTGELKDSPLITALNARNDAAGSYGAGGAGAATASSSS